MGMGKKVKNLFNKNGPRKLNKILRNTQEKLSFKNSASATGSQSRPVPKWYKYFKLKRKNLTCTSEIDRTASNCLSAESKSQINEFGESSINQSSSFVKNEITLDEAFIINDESSRDKACQLYTYPSNTMIIQHIQTNNLKRKRTSNNRKIGMLNPAVSVKDICVRSTIKLIGNNQNASIKEFMDNEKSISKILSMYQTCDDWYKKIEDEFLNSMRQRQVNESTKNVNAPGFKSKVKSNSRTPKIKCASSYERRNNLYKRNSKSKHLKKPVRPAQLETFLKQQKIQQISKAMYNIASQDSFPLKHYKFDSVQMETLNNPSLSFLTSLQKQYKVAKSSLELNLPKSDKSIPKLTYCEIPNIPKLASTYSETPTIPKPANTYCGVPKPANAYREIPTTPKPANTYCGVPKPANAYSETPTTPKSANNYYGVPRPANAYSEIPTTPKPANTYCETPKPTNTYCGIPKPANAYSEIPTIPQPANTHFGTPTVPKPANTYYEIPTIPIAGITYCGTPTIPKSLNSNNEIPIIPKIHNPNYESLTTSKLANFNSAINPQLKSTRDILSILKLCNNNNDISNISKLTNTKYEIFNESNNHCTVKSDKCFRSVTEPDKVQETPTEDISSVTEIGQEPAPSEIEEHIITINSVLSVREEEDFDFNKKQTPTTENLFFNNDSCQLKEDLIRHIVSGSSISKKISEQESERTVEERETHSIMKPEKSSTHKRKRKIKWEDEIRAAAENSSENNSKSQMIQIYKYNKRSNTIRKGQLLQENITLTTLVGKDSQLSVSKQRKPKKCKEPRNIQSINNKSCQTTRQVLGECKPHNSGDYNPYIKFSELNKAETSESLEVKKTKSKQKNRKRRTGTNNLCKPPKVKIHSKKIREASKAHQVKNESHLLKERITRCPKDKDSVFQPITFISKFQSARLRDWVDKTDQLLKDRVFAWSKWKTNNKTMGPVETPVHFLQHLSEKQNSNENIPIDENQLKHKNVSQRWKLKHERKRKCKYHQDSNLPLRLLKKYIEDKEVLDLVSLHKKKRTGVIESGEASSQSFWEGSVIALWGPTSIIRERGELQLLRTTGTFSKNYFSHWKRDNSSYFQGDA